jgi:glycosyltransferase involved in cell wall biosynthesis
MYTSEEIMERLSVIIPSYNSLLTIPASLGALLQDCHSNYIYEVIVVDSSDNPADIEYLDTASIEYGFKLIRLHKKTMPSIARNIGANAAVSRYIAFIDSDVIVSPGWSRVVMQFFADGGEVGAGAVCIPEHQKWKLLPLGQLYLQFNEYLDARPQTIKPFAPSCNLFCTKECFDAVGGFPPVRASEDVLFCLKLSKKKALVFLPNAYIFHIFREKYVCFLKNQIMLGKYIAIYRSALNPSAIYLKNFGALFFSPMIAIVKMLRIVSRIAFTNNTHRLAFILSSPIFILGLLFWTYGFILGGFSDETI